MVRKLFIIAAIALVGCNSDEVDVISGGEADVDLFEKPEVVIENGKVSLSRAQEEVMGCYEDFALTSTCDLMPEESNFAYSPLSATLALSLAANAADGTTYDELVTAMGFKGKDIDEINRLNYTLLQALPVLNSGVEVSFANALFTSSEYTLLRPFKSRLTEAYDGNFFTLKNKHEATQINAWVSEKTKGLITDLMDESDFTDNDPSVAFVNSCYLNGSWFGLFTKIEEKPFTLLDGSQTTAQYAEELQLISYTYIDGMEVVSLPLGIPLGKTSVYEVDFVLPAPGQSVSKALATVNDLGGFSAVANSMKEMSMVLSIPKFKISDKIDLVDWLKLKGVKELFEPTADLFKMSLTPSYVTMVKQRCEFELDENGVSGAAATDVGGLAGHPGWKVDFSEITLDRPFAYCVREASSSAILFIGQVVQP